LEFSPPPSQILHSHNHIVFNININLFITQNVVVGSGIIAANTGLLYKCWWVKRKESVGRRVEARGTTLETTTTHASTTTMMTTTATTTAATTTLTASTHVTTTPGEGGIEF